MKCDSEEFREKSSLRVFDLRSNLATEAKCKEACMKNDLCVAFSAIWNNWCIGCKVKLDEQITDPAHQGAIAFKKIKRTGIFIADVFYENKGYLSYRYTKHLNLPSKFSFYRP